MSAVTGFACAAGSVLGWLALKGLVTILATEEIFLALERQVGCGFFDVKADTTEVVVIIANVTGRHRSRIGGRGRALSGATGHPYGGERQED